MSEQRGKYESALATIQHLILLGEKHIPCGPPNAYSIIDDIVAYVASLEVERAKLVGGRHYQQNSIDVQRAIQPSPTSTIGEYGNLIQENLDRIKRDEASKQFHELQRARDEAEKLARMFPKVTL